MAAKKKMCVLEDNKVCDDCGECNVCDLNPKKVCDNCGKCLGLDADSRAILIEDVILNGNGHTESENSVQN